MEIPYIVNPRKDTGLTNSKIAIWLFLASEVMLFGGLFSSYIFLRIFADFPWPERALPVLPGLLNTFILIASSVTVVFAWAALKLRRWKMFVGNMAFTLVCAAVFMGFKYFEYSAKFHHHAVQYNDWAVLEGHTHGGNQFEIAADSVNVSLVSYYDDYVNEILSATTEDGEKTEATPVLAAPYIVSEIADGEYNERVLFERGTALSVEMLEEAKVAYIDARTYNEKLRTKLLRDAWYLLREGQFKDEFADLKDWESKVKDKVSSLHAELISEAEDNNQFLIENGNMAFVSNGAPLKFQSSWGRMIGQSEGEDASVSLLDGTVVKGTAGDSDLGLMVDAVDWRHLVMKAEEKGLDADALIEKSVALQGDQGKEGEATIRKVWEAHKVWREFFRRSLEEEYGTNDRGVAKRVPTAVDNYRVTWKQMVAYHKLGYDINEDNWRMVTGGEGTGEYADADSVYPGMIEGFTGANHNREDFKAAFVDLEVPRDAIRFDSVFSPKMNNYYAIYFTVTGLHGLHVIGGAIVLGYYLFFGRKMYLANPEWLANRVEIGGLFWHFVDLVWIFVFPIFYLM